MLSALVFTALLGVAAYSAEIALRGARRATRWPWLIALAASVAWPLIAPIARRFLPADGSTLTVATLPSISVVPDQIPASTVWTARFDTLLLVLWMLATAVMLVRLARALVQLARIRHASEKRVVDGVQVLVSGEIGPAVIGVVQPSVVMPAALLDLDAPLRRLVLRHEEEHCRARDPWIVIGSAVALALVPWNLPLWWIVRRARLALEVDCDARVLATESGSTQYGKLLLLISQRQSVTPYAPMLAASRTHLERRIAAMLPIHPSGRRAKIGFALVATIVAGVAACSSRIADVASPAASVAPSPTMVPASQPYFEFQVERPVRQIPGTGNIRYPDALRTADVQGVVLAQFVVDENGLMEPGSYKVLKSDHQLFSNAVEMALPNMRFAAAEIGGKKVRQLVQQPFTFSLSKSEVAPSASTRSAERLQPVSSDVHRGKGAQQIPGTGNLRYPDALRSANVEGEVLAQFVVDVNGEVLPGSLKVLRSTHPLFVDAVKSAVPTMRFYPAEVDGKKVRQLLERPFTFSLSK
jgi:TonB family protein